MDYSEARDAFFGERTGDVRDLDWSTPARRLRDAIEPLATICFWSEPAYDAYAARGLDFLQGYVWGRASALGEPQPGVVASAFGVFEPGLVAGTYTSGRETCSLDDVLAAKVEGSTAALRTVLGDSPDGLGEAVAALRAAAEAAPSLGRAFFSGLADLDWPTDDLGALWHGCSLLREHRGDGHLAALACAGIDGVQANLLTEAWIGWEPLAYTGSRAWSPEAMTAARAALVERGLLDDDGALTEAGRLFREDLERATDLSEQPVLDALTAAAESTGGLDALLERLEGWSAQVVEHGWFPPDPYKRAAG